jgi:hypothetical protein
MTGRNAFKAVQRQIGLPLIAIACTAATAGNGNVLQQNGPWKMDYATNASHLSATFGQGKSEIQAQFTRIAPQDGFRVTLIGTRLGYQSELRTRAQLEFRPATQKAALSYVTHGSVGPKNARIPAVFSDLMRLDNRARQHSGVTELPDITPASEKAINALYVKLSGRDPFTFDLVSMGAPMAAMRTCTDDLVRSWGYDPAEIAKRQSRARPVISPARWAQPEDYPSAMLTRGASAVVDFRLAIDEKGLVTDCFVLGSTTPPTIGPYSCDVIKRRARFAPSLDKEGRPTKDIYINRIFWQMG